MKLCNNPIALRNKWKRDYYLFNADTRQLIQKYDKFEQLKDFFGIRYFAWQLRKFLSRKLIFDGYILTHSDNPNYDQFKPYIRKYRPKKLTQMSFNAFLQQKKFLDGIDRGIPFFDSVVGLNKHWKPQHVLNQAEAKQQLQPCFPQSRFYISKKHVMYIKCNDLYYKLDMIC